MIVVVMVVFVSIVAIRIAHSAPPADQFLKIDVPFLKIDVNV